MNTTEAVTYEDVAEQLRSAKTVAELNRVSLQIQHVEAETA